VENGASLKVGIVGFGEVGQNLTTALKEQGVSQVSVYSNGRRNSPPYSASFREQVEAAGGTLVDTIEEVVAGSDVVISSVVVASTESVGNAIAAAARAGQLVVDVNSAGPDVKIGVSGKVTDKGGLYADVAIMGMVRLYGAAVPRKASGSGAARFKELFEPLGLNIQLLDDRPGTASTLKMVRSLAMKSMGMVMLEALLTASALNLGQAAFDAICEPMDGVKFTDWAKAGVLTNGLAARRRADETRSAIELMQKNGIDPVMASGALERMERLITLKFEEIFPGEPPTDYLEVLPHYREASPAGSSVN
jgi:3-hydroxyisobutyrate dehydrogenase-like beta-hydroxyacid dehydrogenase